MATTKLEKKQEKRINIKQKNIYRNVSSNAKNYRFIPLSFSVFFGGVGDQLHPQSEPLGTL